jgi:hypothetical protein
MTFRPKFYTEQQDTVVHLAELEKEIDWNERRLFTLVWGEDDRRQTEDYIADLRQERQQLLAVLNG